jgi:hypothetical protein
VRSSVTPAFLESRRNRCVPEFVEYAGLGARLNQDYSRGVIADGAAEKL